MPVILAPEAYDSFCFQGCAPEAIAPCPFALCVQFGFWSHAFHCVEDSPPPREFRPLAEAFASLAMETTVSGGCRNQLGPPVAKAGGGRLLTVSRRNIRASATDDTSIALWDLS